ncbi:MAG TPA: SUMF1/EgtB/PvdO family nonheme iron enzyme [Roseiflexaceae bacterium]|nr:SUMF1/EgtB/PvdO family nonheme iron enzyme [Roseiflexaceae bacterium]
MAPQPALPSWVPALVRVPAGPFLIGSAGTDTQADDNETPQHRLELPDFWIGKTPITNAQFRPFVEGDGYTNHAYWTAAGWGWRQQAAITHPGFWTESTWNGADYPVVGVSWFEAAAYCHWLSAQTGHLFRLPSEAEWEKAARGPDGRIWPWGNGWDAGRCNSAEAGIRRTSPAGQFPSGASPCGALDMAGNVWEWCATMDGKNYPYLLEDEWTERYLDVDEWRIIRGGVFYVDQKRVRGAYRTFNFPRDRVNQGLRVASYSPHPDATS